MKALLVNPWIHDFSAYDLWIRPLNLLDLAAKLEKVGIETSLIDLLERKETEENKKYNTGKFNSAEIEKPKVLRFVPLKFKRYGKDEKTFILFRFL